MQEPPSMSITGSGIHLYGDGYCVCETLMLAAISKCWYNTLSTLNTVCFTKLQLTACIDSPAEHSEHPAHVDHVHLTVQSLPFLSEHQFEHAARVAGGWCASVLTVLKLQCVLTSFFCSRSLLAKGNNRICVRDIHTGKRGY